MEYMEAPFSHRKLVYTRHDRSEARKAYKHSLSVTVTNFKCHTGKWDTIMPQL